MIEGGSFVRTDAYTWIEQSCHSLFHRELGDMPAEIILGTCFLVSRMALRSLHVFKVRSPFRDLINNLVVTMDRFLTGSHTTSANYSQPSAQYTEPLIAPIPLVWSVALRVNWDIFIQASIEYVVIVPNFISFICLSFQNWVKL